MIFKDANIAAKIHENVLFMFFAVIISIKTNIKIILAIIIIPQIK